MVGMAAVWGSKFPAQSGRWEDVAGPSDIGLVAFLQPKVDRSTLKALLMEGKCKFAGIPIGSCVSTGFRTPTDHGSGAKYWSLITFTCHADADAAKVWLAKFKSEDTFAQIIGSKNQFPETFPQSLNTLGGLFTCCGTPEERYIEGRRGELEKEQVDVADQVANAPAWAKAAGGWYMINLVLYYRICSSDGRKAVSNLVYGIRMMFHLATSFGKSTPVCNYAAGDVISESQKIPYKPELVGGLKYDLQLGEQMFRSEYFKAWYPWKALAGTDAWITFPLDAECSQWES